MGKINSRTKGKVAELEFSKFLTERGFPARRGAQFHGGSESPDVVSELPDWHCECKRTETLSLYKAMDQATTDAAGRRTPFVAHRRNKKPWLAVCYAEDFVKLVSCQKVLEGLTGLRLKDLSSIEIQTFLDKLKSPSSQGSTSGLGSVGGASVP